MATQINGSDAAAVADAVRRLAQALAGPEGWASAERVGVPEGLLETALCDGLVMRMRMEDGGRLWRVTALGYRVCALTGHKVGRR